MAMGTKELGRAMAIGVEFFATIAAGFVAGRFIDRRTGGRGWATWIGLVVGVALAFRALFAFAKQVERAAAAEDKAGEERAVSDRGDERTGARGGRPPDGADDDGPPAA